MLYRVLCKAGDKFHMTLNGYIREKGTSHCITTFQANNKAKYFAFVDLQGAFDKEQGRVILSELAKLGIKGKLLSWIKGYFSNRRTKVLFQGNYSTTRYM